MDAFGMLEVIRDDISDNLETVVVERNSPSGLPEPPNASASVNGRTATVYMETSSMRIKSAVSSAARWVKGVQLTRLQLNDAMKTALNFNEIAQQLVSFENKDQSGGRPSEHKRVTADTAQTLPKSLHSASPSPARLILKPSNNSGKNGAADFTSSVAYPLLPGATALTDGRFLSAQSIFDILSEPKMRERAVSAIPIGPKVNCYFLLNVGAELTDYDKYFDNRQRIRDKLRDGIGSRVLCNSNNICFTLSASGVLKYIDYYKPNKDSLLDLRMHCFRFRNSEQLHCDQTATLRICWFFNAERSPAPGFIVVMYLGATHNGRPHKHSLKAMTSTTSFINKVKEKTVKNFADKETEKQDEKCEGCCQNGAAESASSVAYPLLPGATALTGGRFLTAQSIFDILSEPTMRERAVSAIPTGPKVNCYYILNIGSELTDYEKYCENRQRISDKLRDGVGARDLYSSTNNYFSLSDTGILKYIDLSKNKNLLPDLRMYCARFRNSKHADANQTATLRVCWFFNAKRTPAPGYIILMYLLAPSRAQPHKQTPTLIPITGSTNKTKERTTLSLEKDNDESDELKPPTKRKRENADSDANFKVAGSTGSNNNLKFPTTPSVDVESDSESEFMRTIVDLDECSRSPPNQPADTSLSKVISLAGGNRPRGRPRKNSRVTPMASPATGTYKHIKSTPSSPNSELPGCFQLNVSQYELESKHNTRIATGQQQLLAGSSPISREFLPVGKRPRGRPRKRSGISVKASPATVLYKCIRSPQSSFMKFRRGRPPRSMPLSALAAKLSTRLAAIQNQFIAQRTSLKARTSKADDQVPTDQMLLSLGLRRVAPAPAASKPSATQMSLPMAQLRALAYDMFFSSVPDPASVSLVHSLLSFEAKQPAPEQASKSNAPTSKLNERQLSASESNKNSVSELDELGVRESPLHSIVADPTSMHNWNSKRVSELVTYVLRDVGTDEATIAAVRAGFAREAIDGEALTRLGQEELSQRFGLLCGLALRLISSVLSYLSVVSVSKQLEPSPVVDTTACGETEPITSSTAVFDANVNLEPLSDSSDVKFCPDGETLTACEMR